MSQKTASENNLACAKENADLIAEVLTQMETFNFLVWKICKPIIKQKKKQMAELSEEADKERQKSLESWSLAQAARGEGQNAEVEFYERRANEQKARRDYLSNEAKRLKKEIDDMYAHRHQFNDLTGQARYLASKAESNHDVAKALYEAPENAG